MQYAYKIDHNRSGIESLAVGDAENDFAESNFASVIFNESQVEGRARWQVKQLIEWNKKEIAPYDEELLTDDETAFTRIYVKAYKRRFLFRQEYYQRLRKEKHTMSDHIHWLHTELTIPASKMVEAMKVLEEDHEEKSVAGKEMEAVLNALAEEGFEAESTEFGKVIIYGQSWDIDDDSIEDDPTLKSLIGIFTPGSFITGYNDDGTYWQLRYTENSREMVYGTVTFRNDPRHKYTLEIETD